MEKPLETFKVIATGILTLITNQLGGADTALSLMTALIVCDFITGVLFAILNGELSSRAMRDGLVRKLLVFMVVFIAFRIDKCIIDVAGDPIMMFGKHIYVRTLFIIYACVEEGISLLENLAKLGVPTPTWVRQMLKQVSNTANNSAPKVLVSMLKKFFKEHLTSDYDIEDDDEKSSESSSDTIDKKEE